MTYLELCQDLVGQFGLSGGTGPTTVAGQQGELLNVTRWIRDACLYIENLWEDWRFHWTEYSGTVAVNTNTATAPATPVGVVVRTWNLKSIKIRISGSGDQFQRIPYLRWDDFSEQYDPATDDASDPTCFTIAPDDTLRFNCRVSSAYDVKGEFWRMPVALAVDNDTPLIPKAYHRLIVCRAVVMYADREDAPELVSGCGAEYTDMMEKLEGLCLPGARHRRQSMDHGEQASGAESWTS